MLNAHTDKNCLEGADVCKHRDLLLQIVYRYHENGFLEPAQAVPFTEAASTNKKVE